MVVTKCDVVLCLIRLVLCCQLVMHASVCSISCASLHPLSRHSNPAMLAVVSAEAVLREEVHTTLEVTPSSEVFTEVFTALTTDTIHPIIPSTR